MFGLLGIWVFGRLGVWAFGCFDMTYPIIHPRRSPHANMAWFLQSAAFFPQLSVLLVLVLLAVCFSFFKYLAWLCSNSPSDIMKQLI